jgi:hypothetical protein
MEIIEIETVMNVNDKHQKWQEFSMKIIEIVKDFNENTKKSKNFQWK